MVYMEVIGSSLYQWEVGRRLQVVPLRGMRVDSVHFSNYGDTEALVVKPREEDGIIVADIPNILLQDARNIVAYSVNVSADKVETIRECVFPVRKRAKPSDYVYTETEVRTLESLSEQIKEIKEKGTGSGVNIPGGAKVGQTIVVKAVDENGKPTEWEAVDRPVYIADVAVAWGGFYSFTDGDYATLFSAYNGGATIGLNLNGTLYYLAKVDGENNLHFGLIPYSNAESAEAGITSFYLRVSPDNSITQTRRDIATEAFVREVTKGSVHRFYLNITADPETGEPVAAETFEEVLSAYNEGMDIVAKITPPDDQPPVCIPLNGYFGEFIFAVEQNIYMDADLYGIRIIYGPERLEIVDDFIGVFEGATEECEGTPGFVPMPFAGDQNKFLRGDGTWAEVPSGGGSGGNLNNYVPLFYPTVPVGEGREGDTFVHQYWESDSEKVSWKVLAISVPQDYDLSILPDFSISSGLFYPYKTGFMKREIAEETWAFFTIYSTDGTQHKVLVCHRGNFEQAKADFQAYYC